MRLDIVGWSAMVVCCAACSEVQSSAGLPAEGSYELTFQSVTGSFQPDAPSLSQRSVTTQPSARV